MGCHLAEQVGIIDERAEEIDGLNAGHSGRNQSYRGVVGGVQPDQDIVTLDRLEPLEDAGKNRAADLGSAPSATCGNRRKFPEDFGAGQFLVWGRGWRCFHLWQCLVLLHPSAVDPVLQYPHPFSFERPGASRSHGASIAGADETQEGFLRLEWTG